MSNFAKIKMSLTFVMDLSDGVRDKQLMCFSIFHFQIRKKCQIFLSAKYDQKTLKIDNQPNNVAFSAVSQCINNKQ